MKKMRSDQTLILISAVLICLSIIFSFVSNHYESRVMGDAALGVAIIAPEPNSPQWAEKRLLSSKADFFFNVGVVCGFLAVFVDLYVAFRSPEHGR